ncbi:MAG: alpha-N-acetylglucosaminidase [Bacteroidales bacterium]|nr:alpha-N-acetylglucosaminidase [Bacteroidales bacterium]
MKRKLFLAAAAALVLAIPSAFAGAIEDLSSRILGSRSSRIVFVTDESVPDHFRIEQKGSKIVISGDCPVSQAAGLNYYMKNFLGVDYPWMKAELRIPRKFPKVKVPVERTAKTPKRFFLNYCTFGYTLPWCGWEEWEWLLDWMALNGINMPLAITGQEYVWLSVWQEMGLSEDDVRMFFTGPAHLPWHRMANLDSFQGPLPMSWICGQKDLQKQILQRERELGMTPVLPAFAGHVPEKIKGLFPEADIKRLYGWCDFPPTYFLNPTDPLFQKIQKLFLQKQEEVFGTDHYYGTDPFNEMQPPSWDPDYLAGVMKKIFGSLQQVDPEAKWVEMAWIYINAPHGWVPETIKATMEAVPQDKIIMLDYMAEKTELWRKTESHYGQPFIWCYLGNFGGNTVLEGDIREIDNRLNAMFGEDTSCIGIGSTLESFSVAPHTFEYLFDHVWADSLDTHEWIRRWSDLRLGRHEEECCSAWEKMVEEIFVQPAADFYGSTLCREPAVTTDSYAKLAYDNDELIKCAKAILAHPANTKEARYDIVMLYSQILSNLFTRLTDEFNTAALKPDLARMQELAPVAREICNEMDRLLLTHEDFLFGKWIENARRFGTTEEEKDYFETNARTILTRWGGSLWLNDYARRLWQGLVGDYYRQRYDKYFNMCIDLVSDGKPIESGMFMDRKHGFGATIEEMAADIISSRKVYPSRPDGDSFKVAGEIDAKLDVWRSILWE